MDDRRLEVLARQRNNVLSTRDAARLGMSRAALAQHANRHGWARPAPGVLLLPGTMVDYRRAVLVVLRVAGDARVAVAGRAAAYLWGMTTRPPPRVDVLVPMDRHDPDLSHLRLRARENGARITVTAALRRTRTLRRSDVTRLGGVPITVPARTVIDGAAGMDVDELRSVVIDAQQRRILRLEDVAGVHERISRYPGRARVRRVLRDLDPQECDSWLEWEFRRAARLRGFRPHPGPFPFRCSDGVVVHLDVAFPAQWVMVECDGFGFHADRSSLVTDHLRQNRTVADGWRPLRVDWTRLTRHADDVFAELDRLLSLPPAVSGPAPAAVGSPRRAGRRAGR